MKKVAIILIFTFLLLGFWSRSAVAQEGSFTYERAYNDYVFNLDQYQKLHSDYEIAKSGYLKNPTLAAQAEAIQKTKAMLNSRDEVVKTHLVALKLKLIDTVGVSSNDKISLGTQIDTEVIWHRNHQARLVSSGNLEDLTEDSDEASDRFLDFTEPLVYKTLTIISVGKTIDFRNQERNIVSQIENKLIEIRSDNIKDVSLIERWILEIKDRFDRSGAKEQEALALINQTNTNTNTFGNRLKDFNSSQARVSESLQYLKEANFYLKEIIKEIKYE